MPRSQLLQVRTVTAFLAIAAGLITFSSLEFMLVEIQTDFSMSADGTIVVAQIAAGASLVAVFLAGALGDRLGDRRVLMWASAAYCVGALIVGVAPNVVVLVVGLALGAIGSVVMAIIGLSVLNKTFPDRAERARAFGAFAVIAPAVSIVVPLLSSAIIPHSSWRAVIILWVLVGLASVQLARRALPKDHEALRSSELATPTLAGIALSGIALAVSFVGLSPKNASHFHHGLIAAGISVAALIALIVAMRRLENPTLDLRSLRPRGSSSVLINAINAATEMPAAIKP